MYFCQSATYAKLRKAMLLLLLWGVSSCERTHLGMLICAKLRMAMLLLLGLLGGANTNLLVSSINTLLTYSQVNSSLLFTSNETIAFMDNSLTFNSYCSGQQCKNICRYLWHNLLKQAQMFVLMPGCWCMKLHRCLDLQSKSLQHLLACEGFRSQ